VFINYTSVAKILSASKIGDPSKLNATEKAIRPDIADVRLRKDAEIKPDTPVEQAKGRQQLKDQLNALNKTLPANEQQFTALENFSGERIIAFIGGKYVWRLDWSTDKGLVTYHWQRSQSEAAWTRKEQKAQEQNAWVEPSVADIAADAKNLARWVGVGTTLRAMIGPLTEGTQAAQNAVGAAAAGAIAGAMMNSRQVTPASGPGGVVTPGGAPALPANDNGVSAPLPAANGN
jgi:hypothetical protein